MKKITYLVTVLALAATGAAGADDDYRACLYQGEESSHGATLPNGQTCDDGKFRGEAVIGGGIPEGFGTNPCDSPEFQCEKQ